MEWDWRLCVFGGIGCMAAFIWPCRPDGAKERDGRGFHERGRSQWGIEVGCNWVRGSMGCGGVGCAAALIWGCGCARRRRDNPWSGRGLVAVNVRGIVGVIRSWWAVISLEGLQLWQYCRDWLDCCRVSLGYLLRSSDGLRSCLQWGWGLPWCPYFLLLWGVWFLSWWLAMVSMALGSDVGGICILIAINNRWIDYYFKFNLIIFCYFLNCMVCTLNRMPTHYSHGYKSVRTVVIEWNIILWWYIKCKIYLILQVIIFSLSISMLDL